MQFKNIAVLTSKESWFVPYSEKFTDDLNKKGYSVFLFFDHRKISGRYEVVFILSYFKIIGKKYLSRHKHNLVVHESALPKGRGWSPLFWQILEGKNTIPIVIFEAGEGMDEGQVYLKDYIRFKGHELCDEIRKRQALKTIEMCLSFLNKKEPLKPRKQIGRSTYYRKRTPEDSRVDIDKTIKEQFNKFRIVDNRRFPAFFEYRGNKYLLEIRTEEEDK